MLQVWHIDVISIEDTTKVRRRHDEPTAAAQGVREGRDEGVRQKKSRYTANFSYLCKLHYSTPIMSKNWLITLLLLSSLYAGAQSIRLTKYDAPNALYLDFDRLYDFNMYERSRLNLSMFWVSPNQTAAQQRTVFGQWMLSPYVGYGFGDHAWKYGLGTQLRLPGTKDVRLLLWVYNDLERAASRRLEDYTTLTPSLNNGIVTSRGRGTG